MCMQTRNSNKVSNSLQHLIMLKSGNFHYPFPCPHTPKDQLVTENPYHVFTAFPWEWGKLQSTQCQSLWHFDEHLLP